MNINFDPKRKGLGLLCILWCVGLPFLFGVVEEGLAGGVIIFLTRSIFIFTVPPYAIWMLPCFLTGVYQLFVGKGEKQDKIIFYSGLVLTILGLALFFFTPYNPTTPHEHSLLALVTGAGFLILLNGLWSIREMKHKPYSRIRYTITFVLSVLLVLTSYSAVYGRPFTSDPFFYYLGRGNVCEELSLEEGGAVLELTVVDTRGNPVQYLEIELVSEEQNLYGEGILEFSSITNNKGVAVFKVPPVNYWVRFNTINLPKNLTLPSGNRLLPTRRHRPTSESISGTLPGPLSGPGSPS